VTVTAPDGRTWEVSRHMRWPRLRRWTTDGWDVGPVDFLDVTDGLGGVIISIVAILIISGLILVLLPFILFVVEVPIVIAASIVFSRSWVVTARSLDEVREWRVRGFLRSRAAVREVADELRRGVTAEPEHAEVGA
jgi:hypothetical protein